MDLDIGYGKVKIPIEDLQQIKIGFHCDEKLQGEIEHNIQQLDSKVFQNRQLATNELYKQRYFSFFLLHQSKLDSLEFNIRRDFLFERINNSGSFLHQRNKNDSVDLLSSSVYKGRILNKKFEFQSKLIKKFELLPQDIYSIQFLQPKEFDLKIEMSKLIQKGWYDSKVKFSGKIQILSSGSGHIIFSDEYNEAKTDFFSHDIGIITEKTTLRHLGQSIILDLDSPQSLCFGLMYTFQDTVIGTEGYFNIRIKQIID